MNLASLHRLFAQATQLRRMQRLLARDPAELSDEELDQLAQHIQPGLMDDLASLTDEELEQLASRLSSQGRHR